MANLALTRIPALWLYLRRVGGHVRAGRWRRAGAALRALTARGRSGPNAWARLAGRHSKSKQWDEAVHAFEAAVALDGSRPEWLARLGRTYERAKRWDSAIGAYEKAVTLDDTRPEWFARLGALYDYTGRPEQAVRAFEAAAVRDHDRPELFALVGALNERLSHDDRAAEAYRQWMARDSEASDLDRTLLSASTRRFAARRMVAGFVAQRLPEIRERALAHRVEGVAHDPRVFMYWGQGFAQAPPVVRRCQAEVLRHHAPDEVVFLDDELVPYYLQLPVDVRNKIAEDRAKFSDVLRVALLAEYGGVWIDATCLTTGRVVDRVRSLAPNGFFAFTSRPARISSWFLASEPGGYIATMMREANYLYWEHFDRPNDYYYFHYLFEALYFTDSEFRALWDATPRLRSRRPHRFRGSMYAPYDPVRFRSLLRGSFVHKLSHKVPPGRLSPDTMLAHLVRHGSSTDSVAWSGA